MHDGKQEILYITDSSKVWTKISNLWQEVMSASIMNNYVVYSETTGLANHLCTVLERSKVVNHKVEFYIRLNKLSAMESSTLRGMSVLPHTCTQSWENRVKDH